jgi:GTP-binding protein
VDDLALVREEVGRHAPDLLERPQLVAATKRDLAQDPDPLPGLSRAARGLGLDVLPLSAVSGEGVLALKRRLRALLAGIGAGRPVEGGA